MSTSLAIFLRREDTKTSKRCVFIMEDGSEEKFLSGEFEFSTSLVYRLSIEDNTKYGMRILTSIALATEEETKSMMDAYGPSPVPELGKLIDVICEVVNTVPDDSFGGLPRTINKEDLVDSLFYYFNNDSDEAHKFMTCPASLKHHDSQDGGLIRHIYGCLKIAKNWFMGMDEFENYERHPFIVMISLLFHDLGKVRQYEILDEGTYESAEDAAYMNFHIGFGAERWAQKGQWICEKLGFPEAYKDILHNIKSHHGPKDHDMGSEADPYGHDAWTVHAIDLMQSRQERRKKA